MLHFSQNCVLSWFGKNICMDFHTNFKFLVSVISPYPTLPVDTHKNPHHKVPSDHKLLSPQLVFMFFQHIMGLFQCLAASVVHFYPMAMVC